MKHLFSYLLCFFLFFATATPIFADEHAHQQQGKKELREEERPHHLVEVMQLTYNDARHFTELYVLYSKEMRDARKKYARIRARKVDGKSVKLTEDQVRQNLELQFALSQAVLDIRQKYHQEYLKFLAPSKIELLYNLEKKSAEKLREMVEKRRRAQAKSGGKPTKRKDD